MFLDNVNPLVLDFNGDGIVDQSDLAYAANHINMATAEMVNRYLNPPPYIDPDINTDQPQTQHWLDFLANGTISIVDFNEAKHLGVPFEILMHMWYVATGTPMPTSMTQVAFQQWKEQATSPGHGYLNDGALSWYPITQHSSTLPYSSVSVDYAPPAGENPSTEEPLVPSDEYHPLDFNMDGTVNLSDINIAVANYGQTTAQMVVRHITGAMTYDINGDGIVDVNDLIAAQQAGVPQNILAAMHAQILNPPEPTQEYDSTPPTAEDGSGYHPLDGNQDGGVGVVDIVYWCGRNDLTQVAKQLIVDMIKRYSIENICPYDLNQDGTINVLDVNLAIQAGVPQNIVEDIVANIGTEVPMPPLPEIPEPVEPGPTIVTNNLWLPEGSWGIMSGTPYYGPVHKHSNNLGRFYMTEYHHKRHSRILIPLINNPEEALTELPNGAPVPIVDNPLPSTPPSTNNFFSDLTDLNGDGIVNVLDQIMQNNSNFSSQNSNNNSNNNNNQGSNNTPSLQDQLADQQQNNTGGSGNNNQNNSGGGTDPGGGAY